MKKIIIKGSFVQGYLYHAAKNYDIELIHPPEYKTLEEEVAFVNSEVDKGDVLFYLYFSSWDLPLTDIMREMRCPRIFWNIEDPNHFSTFYKRAAYADMIFTTAQELIRSYEMVYSKVPVLCLTWACEPTLHFPREDDPDFQDRAFDIVFVGNRYPACDWRNLAEDTVLFPAIDWAKTNGKRVGVWGSFDDSPHSWKYVPQVWLDNQGRSPFLTDGSNNSDYTGIYQGFTSAFDVRKLYHQAKLVLCMNEQIHSPSMTSMRTYEACACGNPVLSHWSLATEIIFQSLVHLSRHPKQTEEKLDYIFEGSNLSEDTKKRASRAMLHVYKHHTYSHRLGFILDKFMEYFT